MDSALPKAEGQRLTWANAYQRATKACDHAKAAEFAGRIADSLMAAGLYDAAERWVVNQSNHLTFVR